MDTLELHTRNRRWSWMYARPARMIVGFFVAGLLVMYLTSGTSSAQETTDAAATVAQTAEAAAEEVAYLTQQSADILWFLIAGVLVMFMQAGFAMVETGMTRAKNAVNIMTKNVLDFCLGATLYWAVGYCLMYGYTDGGPSFIGWDTQYLFMSTLSVSADSGNFINSGDWFFQMVFCATAATIVSGAVAERTKLIGYVVATILVTGFIYPIAAGWIWGGNGFLGGMGMRDFAGSTVVHSVGAWAALAGAIIVGPRLGKYNADGSSNAIPGHNLTLATLGVFILWFGWYGFNPGSTLAVVDGVAYVAVTTTLASAAGGLAALITSWFVYGKPDLTMGLNGCLAGLVGITAPCASVEPWAAWIIGAIAGVLVFSSVIFIDKVLKVDDPVGAISVHGVCGIWGTLAVGIFGKRSVDILFWDADTAIKDGLIYGGASQFFTQLIGVVAVFVFVFFVSLIVFAIVKYTIGLRVSDAEQIEGLDLGEHDLAAYPDFQSTNIKSYHLREA